MLILKVLLNLKSKQRDVTVAFVHINVQEGENFVVEMLRGFKRINKVVELKKTLYGLRQSPRAFWNIWLKNWKQAASNNLISILVYLLEIRSFL